MGKLTRKPCYPKEYYSEDYILPKRMNKAHFAKLYGVSWRTINRDINTIESLKKGLLKVKYNRFSKQLRVAWVKVLFVHYSPPLKEGKHVKPLSKLT